jgi:Txe/YoeB family toxin of Txe-Axe toxin-antitoxin module
MRFEFSVQAEQEYEDLLPAIQRAAHKQIDFLVKNIRHPSLHAKKYDEATGLWQARITASWRFYFFIRDDAYYIVSIRKHVK